MYIVIKYYVLIGNDIEVMGKYVPITCVRVGVTKSKRRIIKTRLIQETDFFIQKYQKNYCG